MLGCNVTVVQSAFLTLLLRCLASVLSQNRTSADGSEARASSSKSNGKKRGANSAPKVRARNKRPALDGSDSDSGDDRRRKGSDDEDEDKRSRRQGSKTNGHASKNQGQAAWMENLSDFEKERLDEIIVDVSICENSRHEVSLLRFTDGTAPPCMSFRRILSSESITTDSMYTFGTR